MLSPEFFKPGRGNILDVFAQEVVKPGGGVSAAENGAATSASDNPDNYDRPEPDQPVPESQSRKDMLKQFKENRRLAKGDAKKKNVQGKRNSVHQGTGSGFIKQHASTKKARSKVENIECSKEKAREMSSSMARERSSSISDKENKPEQANKTEQDHGSQGLPPPPPGMEMEMGQLGMNTPPNNIKQQTQMDQLSASKSELAKCYAELVQTEKEQVAMEEQLVNYEQKLNEMYKAYNYMKIKAEVAENTIDQLKNLIQNKNDQATGNTTQHDNIGPKEIIPFFGNALNELSEAKRAIREKEVLIQQRDKQLNSISIQQGNGTGDMEKLQDLALEWQSKEKALLDEKGALLEKLKLTEHALTNTQETALALKKDLDTAKAIAEGAEQMEQKYKEEKNILDVEIANLQQKFIVAEEEHLQQLQETQTKLRDSELTRISLHNQVLELKGNIRVFTRVRPLKEGHSSPFSFPLDDIGQPKLIECATVQEDRGGLASQVKKWRFAYDHVFTAEATQDEVYQEVKPLVQAAIDGFRVCIFAYGQTGSGKTFTMMNSTESGLQEQDDLLVGDKEIDPQGAGIISRAVQDIFSMIALLEAQGWSYSVNMEMVEVYNEQISDLLSPEIIKQKKGRLAIRGQSIVGVQTIPVGSTEEVFYQLTNALASRCSRQTLANASSSRSHCLFTLKIDGVSSEGQKRLGVLNIVDLAGSERLSQVQNEAEVIKETKAINKSLSALGNTIMALSRKEKHVPYRDSKITHLLQHSLGGNSKVLMFCNISPEEENLNESLSSLRFAKKVNECTIADNTRKGKCQQCGF